MTDKLATKDKDNHYKGNFSMEKSSHESLAKQPPINPWIENLDCYAAPRTVEEVVARYGIEADKIVRLASNVTTLGPSPKAKAAALAAIEDSHHYGDIYSEGLMNALEEHYKQQGLNMNKLGIVVGNGLDNVMEHIARLFLHPQCSIVNMPPTFAYYKLIGKWRGVEIINIDRSSTDFSINVQEVIDSLKDNTKIVFLCTPNNPTGNSTSIEEIEQLASSLHEKNCLLFVDHAYIEFVNDDRQDAKHLVEKYPNIIVGYTFSKAFALAGYRVGYALMDRSIKCQYMKVITPFVCSRPSMAAARAALADTEHLQKVLAVNEAGRQQLYKGLTELGISFLPSDTNFILLKNNTHDSCFIVERLMQEGVIVRAMPCVCPYAVRVTIGRDHENTRLLEALAKL